MKKLIVITGTSRGIGKGLCEHYLKKGCRVVGCSRGKASVRHRKYKHYILDATDEKSVIEMVRSITREFGRIDCLINNAGISSLNHIVLTSYPTAEKILKINFLGTFIFLREISKAMIRQKFGRIVNFSTVAVPLKLEGEAVYAASKAAVETLTVIAAKELGKFNITVNAIGPTPMATDLIKNVPQRKLKDLMKRQSVERMGTIKDIARVVDFFIDEQSDFITGQVIYLGGIRG